MSSISVPMTLWNSTLGIGDGQDFATRGYLKALMAVNYPGLRLPPSVSSPLLRFDKENAELADFVDLARPPKEVRMRPLKLIEAGDPRIGKTYLVKAYGMSGERELDKDGNPAFMEVPYTEGAVDPDVDQQTFSTKSAETRCIVIHHDPASICRHYTNLVKHGRAPGVAYVGITAWETSEIPEAVAVILSELDMLIVPSEHTKLAMEASGVSTKIVMVPHAFDEKRWPRPTDEELDHGDRDRFVFYTVATPVERKNLVGLMRTYFKAFNGRTDVVLRIKSSASKGQLKEMAVTALEQAYVPREERPPLQFFTGKWSIDKIREFHIDGDCFVSATRAEGFGLGELESRLCGSRVITTGWGSQVDILGEYDYLTDYMLIPVFNMQGVGCYEPEQEWADPYDESLVECMRSARVNTHNSFDYEELIYKFGQKAVGEKLAAALLEAQRVAAEDSGDELG
jgi:glycosyltransferase involved in cell wall biosynthesis